MLKYLFLIFGISFIYANLILDVKSLENIIKKNRYDIKNRLILAKFYENEKQYEKAEKLINDVLKIDPKNKKALILKKEINNIKKISELKKRYGSLDDYINILFKNKEYKKIIKFYLKFKPSLKQTTLLKIARVAMWEGDYDLSLNILNNIENNLDSIEIKAYDYFYKGDFIKASQFFELLYNATGDKNYGIKLLESYINLGDALKAKRVLYTLKYKLSNKKYKYYLKLINNLLYKHIKNLENIYKNNPTFKNMKNLAIALYNINPSKAIETVKNYLKYHPNDAKADIFLAELYTWNGQTEDAAKILNKYISSENYQAKLLYGKILAWNSLYKKAIIFLSDVYENGNKKQQYEALKTIAFIQMWQNHKQNAKKIFEKLYKQNPNDNEVKEALMILNGKIIPLIKKYKNLIKESPNNIEYILKLADLYYMLPDYNKAAYYYELYLQNNPDKIEYYKTLGDIYLNLKKFYKGFSYWEYYAAIKNTPEAYLDLAKRYHWYGFDKEALNILNKILNKYPKYKKAIELKAKILKVNPRFIYSENQTAIEKYFTGRADKLLVYGDRSYFAGFYQTAAEYYKEYLFIKPDDNAVREKYAYSLEFIEKYKQAAGEFYNLLWQKKDFIIQYHYAYCLQKSGKLKKAKKIYEELLKEAPKPLPEKLKKFINNWKKGWESMNFEKYASFYDKKIRENLYWKLKKQNIFKKAGFISVGIYDPILIKQKDNIYIVKFYQVYASYINKDKGYKTLWIKCNSKKCFIVKEIWKPGKYVTNNQINSIIINIKNNLLQIDKILNSKETKKEIKKETPKEKKNKKIKKIIKKSKKRVYKKQYNLNMSLLTYHDNKKTHYNQIEFSFLKKINNSSYGLYSRFYKLNQNNIKDFGKIIALDIKNRKNNLIIGIDNAKNTNLYLNLSTYLLSHNLQIVFENLVYSRKSICSLNYETLGLEIKKYLEFKNKNLWYSIKTEYINNGNFVLTPQFEYTFYSKKIDNIPYQLFINGWYQFNTKNNSCYYSPNKTDSNLIGIKIYPYKKLIATGSIGYSFWNKSILYKLSLKYNHKFKFLNLNSKCEYSNTSSLYSPNNYKNYQCYINMEKQW